MKGDVSTFLYGMALGQFIGGAIVLLILKARG